MTVRPLLPALALLAAAATSACQAEEAADPVVAVLVPGGADRWEQVDVPAISAAVAAGCEACEVVVLDAEGDAARQADQVEQAVEGGADALVLAPVDAGAAGLVSAAGEVPVVAYGQALAGADEVVAAAPQAVGEAQAQAVLDALGQRPRGRVVVLTGPADGAAAQASAAQRLLERAGLTPDVAPAGADPAAAVRGRAPVAVVAADDVQAGEALAALPGRARVVVVGAGADLDGVRRVVAGDQRATVHVPSRGLAAAAGALAAGLVGGTPPEPTASGSADPSKEEPADDAGEPAVPEPVVVTADRVAQVLVRDGYATIEALCAGSTRRACERLGLS